MIAARGGAPAPVPPSRAPRAGRASVSATLYYLLVTLLLVVLIGGMAAGLALGGRLEELDE